MTKDSYYELCEALGSEPIESEVPIELSDFPYEVRTCFNIYSLLRDNWEPMSGSYLGKDYGNLIDYLKMHLVEEIDYILYVALVQMIDSARAALIAQKKSQATPPKNK